MCCHEYSIRYTTVTDTKYQYWGYSTRWKIFRHLLGELYTVEAEDATESIITNFYRSNIIALDSINIAVMSSLNYTPDKQ